MKKFKKITLFILCAFALNLGCKKNDDTIVKETEKQGEDPKDEDPQSGEFDYTQETINIVLPAGSELDFTSYKVQSVLEDFDISADGSSTANFLKDNTSIAYLFDENDNPILAGFINAEKREISVRSTVEVVLYHTIGTIFLPVEVRQLYIKGISSEINIDDIVAKSETIFKTNNSLIDQEGFWSEIKIETEEFTKELSDSQQGKTNPGINFDIISKSGIRLDEEPGNNILFRNSERRRARAFLYKTKTTNEDNQETILINDIVGENSTTSTQVRIPPTAAVTSVIGLLRTIVSGKGLEIVAVNSEPTTLIATGEEFKATYQARVIGPGRLTVEGLTDEEAKELLRLNIETFALDILLPIISTAIADNDNILLNATDPSVSGLIEAVTALIGTINGANDAAMSGDFSILTSSFLDGMTDNTTAALFEPVLKAAAKAILTHAVDGSGHKVSTATRERILGKFTKFFKALKIADIALQGIDIIRISGAIGTSKPVENFEIDITRGKVNLEPYLAKTKFGDDDVEYTAEIVGQELAAGQAFEYVWTSEGDFGILVDDNTGRTNANTLTTSVNKIKYRAEAAGNGSDEIKVEVFIKEAGKDDIRVDDDKAFVDVVEFELKITPNNITISGGTGLTLSVVDENGNSLVSDENFEYSYEWKTDAQFGKYNGTKNRVTTTVNNVKYEALERSREGTENVSVSVYRKEKGINGKSRLLQTVDGTINISDDPNKKYFNVDASYWLYDSSPESGGTREVYGAGFKIPFYENAISYQIDILEFTWVNLDGTMGDFTAVYSWTNESQNDPVYYNLDDSNEFGVYINGLSINTINANYNESINYITSGQGQAQITITLEDN